MIATLPQGIDGWQSNANLRTSTCGPLGSILGGANILGRNAVISKKYEHLPDHDGLHITMDAILVDSWVRCGSASASRRCSSCGVL